MEIEGHHLEVEVSTDRIIGEDCDMSVIIEMTLGKTIIERCKTIEVKFLEVDIRIIILIIEMTTLEDVEVYLGTDNTQVTSRNDRSSSSMLRAGSRASTNRGRIRCFKCRK